MKDKRIEKFRRLAENMQVQIDNKLCPATASQNLTPRRVRIMESMRKDGERLEKIQAILRGIAEDLECGRELLINVKSKKDIEVGLNVNSEWLKGYLKSPSVEEIKVKELRKLEMGLVGKKIKGFFPTPVYIIEKMLEKIEFVGDKENPVFLEPSAGKGDIVEVIRDHYPKASICSYEINPTLSEILSLKGIGHKRCDFLEEVIPGDIEDPFVDFIIMNPPFEKFQDIKHVRHAYDNFLNSGGRLVAIMSEGIFFRRDKIAVEFREFLSLYGYSEKLETGSFKNSFCSTGVSCRIVVLDNYRGR